MTLPRPICGFALVAVLAFVSSFGVREASGGKLTASWTDNSGGVAAVEVYRRALDEAGFTKLADVPAGWSAFLDDEVVDGITYCYRVRAYTHFGASPYSEEACGASAASTFSIAVRKTGTGSGKVMASGYAIVCGSRCAATYSAGTPITLVAAAARGSEFLGWSGGGCSGVKACVVTGNTAITVTARFGVSTAAVPPTAVPDKPLTLTDR